MMVLCLWQITPEYFTEMTEAFVLQGKEVLKSCYGILAAFSGIGLLPFLLKDVEKGALQESLWSSELLLWEGS